MPEDRELCPYPSVGVDLEDAVRWAEGEWAKKQERSEEEAA